MVFRQFGFAVVYSAAIGVHDVVELTLVEPDSLQRSLTVAGFDPDARKLGKEGHKVVDSGGVERGSSSACARPRGFGG